MMQLLEPILVATAEVFQQPTEALIGQSRKRPIVEARQAAMWAIRCRYPSLSLESIGMALGGRHSTTVGHALVTVEARAGRSSSYCRLIQRLLTRIAPPAQSVRDSYTAPGLAGLDRSDPEQSQVTGERQRVSELFEGALQ